MRTSLQRAPSELTDDQMLDQIRQLERRLFAAKRKVLVDIDEQPTGIRLHLLRQAQERGVA